MVDVDPSKPVILPPPLHYQAEALGLRPVTGYYEVFARPTHESNWSTGFCDWWEDKSNCLLNCFCPCVTFGQIAEIVDEGRTSCLESGALYGFLHPLCCVSCFCGCRYRIKLRRRFLIRGNCCCDCLKHWCCREFALSQEFRELEIRGFDVPAGWRENVEAAELAVAVFRITPVDPQIMRR